jgi:hypothetical protein
MTGCSYQGIFEDRKFNDNCLIVQFSMLIVDCCMLKMEESQEHLEALYLQFSHENK